MSIKIQSHRLCLFNTILIPWGMKLCIQLLQGREDLFIIDPVIWSERYFTVYSFSYLILKFILVSHLCFL